jgi:hypothetical protein
VKFTNFVYICITHGQITIFEQKVFIFITRNTNIYKICELHRAIFSSFYNITNPYMHHCSFTHSKTLFLAAVLAFILDLIKILSIAKITHCSEQIAIEICKLQLYFANFEFLYLRIYMLSQTYRTVPYHTVMLPYVNT